MNTTVMFYTQNTISNPQELGAIACKHLQQHGSRAFIVNVHDPSDPNGHIVTIALDTVNAALITNITSACAFNSTYTGEPPYMVIDPNNPKFSEALAPKADPHNPDPIKAQTPNPKYKLGNKQVLYKAKALNPNPNSDCFGVSEALASAIVTYDISLEDIRTLKHRAFLLICNQTSTIMQVPAGVAGDSRPPEMDNPDLTVRIQALTPHIVRRFILTELTRLSDFFIKYDEWLELGLVLDAEGLHRVIDHLRLPTLKVPEVEAMMLPKALAMMVRRGRIL
jgi:hypothetical protein